MATAEKRVVTDATGQAMLAELRKIPGVMNPLPVEKGGTGADTPEGAREAIGAQEKLGFNVSEELNKRIKSVNETLPDENGNVQIVRVPMADNFTSDESHVVSGTFIERTTGGDTSITDGNAYLGVLYGNSVRTGYTAETKSMETQLVERTDDSQPMTAEINWDAFRTAVNGISTNKTFSYTSVWNENPETYGIVVSGTPKNGDVINVYFIAENRGTITNAAPETFNSANWNLYDNTTGYAKVLKYSDVHGFKIGGTYTGVSFSATVDGERTVVTPDSDGLFAIPSDGYVFVTGGNDTDTYVLMTWSDWEDGYTGDFLTKSVSTIDFSEVMQNVFPFGLCAIGIVTDEINFNDKVATIRIERVAYSTENRIVAENSGRDFIYDANWIYSVKETPEKVRFNVDNDLVVYDHGVEYFTGTEVPLTAFELFGQNLKDKLRREVVAVTPQNFSASQKQIARENIEAAWNSEVIKSINNKVPDANGNITIVEGQSNASYGSYRIDPVIPPAAWSLVNGQYQVAYSDPLIKSTMTGSETWLDNNDAMLGKTTFNTIDGALLIVTAVQPTETWRLHVLLAENGATVLEDVNNKVDESDLAIVEADDTAFHNITAGQYVMWKGEMYKATAAIASGATLSATGSGANLTAVNNGVANELNAGIGSLDSNLQAQITALNKLESADEPSSRAASLSDLKSYISGIATGMKTNGALPITFTTSFTDDTFSTGARVYGTLMRRTDSYFSFAGVDLLGNAISFSNNGGTWTFNKLALNSNIEILGRAPKRTNCATLDAVKSVISTAVASMPNNSVGYITLALTATANPFVGGDWITQINKTDNNYYSGFATSYSISKNAIHFKNQNGTWTFNELVSNSNSVSKKNEIPANSNVNNYTENGIYTIGAGNSSSITNLATTGASELVVFTSTVYTVQTQYLLGDGSTPIVSYQRYLRNNVWSNWAQLVLNSNLKDIFIHVVAHAYLSEEGLNAGDYGVYSGQITIPSGYKSTGICGTSLGHPASGGGLVITGGIGRGLSGAVTFYVSYYTPKALSHTAVDFELHVECIKTAYFTDPING